jgi:hypothetical protein
MHNVTSPQSNVVVEWLALLSHIREVPCSNLGSETGILTEIFRDFPQFFQANAGIVFYLRKITLVFVN